MTAIVKFGRRVTVRGKEDWSHPFSTAYGKKEYRTRLKPGANIVSDVALEKLLKDETFAKDLASGLLTVERPKGQAAQAQAERDAVGDFKKLPQDLLVKSIKDMVDPVLLNRIVKEDDRAKVRDAADARLRSILESGKAE